MGYERKLMRNVSRVEPQKLGLAFVVACFVFSMAFVSVTKLVGLRLMNPIQAIIVAKDSGNPQLSESKLKIDLKVQNNSLTQSESSNQQLEDIKDFKQPERKSNIDLKVQNNSLTQSNSSNQPLEGTKDFKQPDEINLQEISKPLCDFSDKRSDVCEIQDQVIVHGNSSSVYIMNPKLQESYTIKPHARKFDSTAMRRITNISVKALSNYDDPFKCEVNHSIPAIIFSTGGFTGNMFHEFTDVIVPLFITSRKYHGEVQFLISETRPWFFIKYKPYLKALSHYEIIDFNKEERVHCYPNAVIGLKSHKEMSIDPLRSPNGYSMVDFAQTMRKAYSLKRKSAIKLKNSQSKKPRLLIIARKRTRSFKNIDEIVLMAKGLGYEVVVSEADVGLEKFSRIVNTCDVIMGVHGAGLTNIVFLPMNAIVIQIVPLGGLEGIAKLDFGTPALDMKLNYLQYSITEEESTLTEMYPRDHAVFKDLGSIQRQGWMAIRKIYLDQQNVSLDVNRFKGYLEQALQFLHQ
ncbi:uncharacterized protein A4U43_C06F6710 [Asparagus officinalis]|uniref:Glycosyltransferase 61 catalytic domain-containing protein n=1 Tax=Asparagus officinalis TaxID=4686 RepID=A0A5P1ENF8_ASPOF|nr:uncharacterized protein LOC109844158 [Asparagus officinalis]ONK66339.1 uncharacterized protein A4U43_C06F6710 [Asparagus officinalis]